MVSAAAVAGVVLLGAATLVEASGFATYFARVGANGVVSNSSGVRSGTRTAIGTYDILFTRVVNYCGWVANVTGGAAGYATVDLGDNARTVTVVTRGSSGGKVNLPFSLMVQCAP